MSIKDELSAAMAQAKPVLVEFYSSTHPHSLKEDSIIEALKNEMGDRAKVMQINGEKDPEIVQQYKIRTYPTWIIFKDGTEFWRDGGNKPLSELKDMLRRVI